MPGVVGLLKDFVGAIHTNLSVALKVVDEQNRAQYGRNDPRYGAAKNR